MLSIRIENDSRLSRGVVVSLDGSFGFEAFQAFEEKILALERSGVLFYIFDFTRVQFLNSVTAAFLINFAEAAKERGGSVGLSGCNRRIETVLRLLGAFESLGQYATLEEAVESFAQVPLANVQGRSPVTENETITVFPKTRPLRITAETLTVSPSVAVLKISGSLEVETLSLLIDEWERTLEKGVHNVALDMTEVDRISSSALLLLTNLQDSLRAHKGKLSLFGLPPSIKRLFRKVTAELFPIFDSREEAVDALSS